MILCDASRSMKRVRAAAIRLARRPVRLVWCEEFPTRGEAKAAEAQIKKWSRRKKEALLSGRREELSAAARKDWGSYRQRRADERGRAQ